LGWIFKKCQYYQKFLEPILEKDGSLLEIGIRYGGSIVLWNELLKNCRIFGIDTQDTLYENIREYYAELFERLIPAELKTSIINLIKRLILCR
jgi:hypothetical protein